MIRFGGFLSRVDIGRKANPAADALSAYLREGADDFLRNRRGVAGLTLLAQASLGLVALYQIGLIDHVPEPNIGPFDADSVDGSGEAYATLSMPDALLGIASYSLTLLLTGTGGPDRHRERPWIPVVMAGKVAIDALASLYLFGEQINKHRAVCSWCTLAAACSLASFPLALAEARAASGALTRRYS